MATAHELGYAVYQARGDLVIAALAVASAAQSAMAHPDTPHHSDEMEACDEWLDGAAQALVTALAVQAAASPTGGA